MTGEMLPIRLIEITNSQNGTGRTTETTANSYNLWGKLVKQGNGRDIRNGQTQLQNTIQFRIFWRSGFAVTSNWRLVWAGRQYTVQGIDRENERKFFYIITATSSGKS